MDAYAQPICLISDIHLGHPASVLTGPSALVPLFEGAKTVIFNGDSVELRFRKGRERGEADLAELGRIVRAQGAEPVFINGNHDPRVSALNHIELCGGTLLATHGDLLYPEITPWGKESAFLAEHHRKAIEGLTEAELSDFEARLRASKAASIAYELHEPNIPRGPLARIVTHIEVLWPPSRAIALARVWSQTPSLAAELAERYRPRARFIVFGHTHWAGVWHRRGRVVINTGGFLSVLGRLGLWVGNGKIAVRKIRLARGGVAWGREVDVFDAPG